MAEPSWVSLTWIVETWSVTGAGHSIPVAARNRVERNQFLGEPAAVLRDQHPHAARGAAVALNHLGGGEGRTHPWQAEQSLMAAQVLIGVMPSCTASTTETARSAAGAATESAIWGPEVYGIHGASQWMSVCQSDVDLREKFQCSCLMEDNDGSERALSLPMALRHGSVDAATINNVCSLRPGESS